MIACIPVFTCSSLHMMISKHLRTTKSRRYVARPETLLEYEVIWRHIDILVVAVRRLSRRWKVETLLAGPSPTSPMKRRLPTPLFPTNSSKSTRDHTYSTHRSELPVVRSVLRHIPSRDRSNDCGSTVVLLFSY